MEESDASKVTFAYESTAVVPPWVNGWRVIAQVFIGGTTEGEDWLIVAQEPVANEYVVVRWSSTNPQPDGWSGSGPQYYNDQWHGNIYEEFIKRLKSIIG